MLASMCGMVVADETKNDNSDLMFLFSHDDYFLKTALVL